ncbi:CTLH/CRA C-terminal to LisH motif domain [Phytophthora cactorum]|nr:CTLH/CRA C-terminal to LisH motif domain [Phytophthora cactorum]
MRRYSHDITLGSSSHRLGAAADVGFGGTPAKERRFNKKRSSRRRMRISKEQRLSRSGRSLRRDSGTKLGTGAHEHPATAAEGSGPEGARQTGQYGSRFSRENSGMDFLLAKQELIELIKAHNIEEALQFAIKNLAPFGQKSPQFLHEIERTMSVIAFKNPSQSPLGHLLEQAQRRVWRTR